MKSDSKNEPVEESYTLDELAKMNKSAPVTSNDESIKELLKKEGLNNTPSKKQSSSEEIKNLFESIPGVKVEKTNDANTLVDIHVNNPLRRIVSLLEEIKQQKAFSFTFRGSLGIMGVLLTLSVFGFFGGDRILCDKGLQTRTGTLKVLKLTEEATDPTVPWTKAMLQKLFFLKTTTLRQRLVLLSDKEAPIHLITLLTHKPDALDGMNVAVTGNYNACSSTITLKNEEAIEPLQ